MGYGWQPQKHLCDILSFLRLNFEMRRDNNLILLLLKFIYSQKARKIKLAAIRFDRGIQHRVTQDSKMVQKQKQKNKKKQELRKSSVKTCNLHQVKAKLLHTVWCISFILVKSYMVTVFRVNQRLLNNCNPSFVYSCFIQLLFLLQSNSKSLLGAYFE